MYSVLNTVSEYIYFYISKRHYFKHFVCLLVIKTVESGQSILKGHTP